jgi:circadian clock protein KaiC
MKKHTDKKASTGVKGLDHVLAGGLPEGRLYLVEGQPGSGKTTLAMQFLLEGAAQGEPTLYVTLSETSDELAAVAQSHGWSLDGIRLFELSNLEALGEGREQSVLHPWEIELSETVKLITAAIEQASPKRVVFDSLSELRLLAQDPLRYRRQVLTLKQYFAARDITVLMVDDLTGSLDGNGDGQLHSLCHGVVRLDRQTLEYGTVRRRIEVQKLRGVNFRGGRHDFQIRPGGLVVFPRLNAAEYDAPFVGETMSSGIPELDGMLDGGPLRGTCTLITGPAGSGKTNLALQFVDAACRRGERCAIYEFDERIGTLLMRASQMGVDLPGYIEAGLLQVRQIDPAETAPGEFSAMVCDEVDQNQAKVVLIDSLAGYMTAMPQEQHLQLQMHELLAYLNQRGVVTLLINPQQSLVGSMSSTGLNVSYIADAVLLLRFFEADARVRKALAVIKNRSGPHEDSIRELRIDRRGLRLGETLHGFRGVLSGVPRYVGAGAPLLEDRGDAG